MKKIYLNLIPLIVLLLVATACQNQPTATAPSTSPTNAPTDTEVETTNSTESGYPVPPSADLAASDPAYPIPTISGMLEELPEIPELAVPEAGFAAIGGALVDPENGGFIPVRPQSVTLGEIVTDDQGRPVFLRSKNEGPQAQLLNAGVFLFNGVEPGRYGLVIDIGIGTFPILDDAGDILLFDVEDGESLDLGVLTFELE